MQVEYGNTGNHSFNNAQYTWSSFRLLQICSIKRNPEAPGIFVIRIGSYLAKKMGL